MPASRGLAQARSLVLGTRARHGRAHASGPSATFIDPFVLEGVKWRAGPGSVASAPTPWRHDLCPDPAAQPGRRPLRFGVVGAMGTGSPQERIGVDVQSGLGEKPASWSPAITELRRLHDSPEGEVLNSGSRDIGFLPPTATRSRAAPLHRVQGDYGRDVERPRTTPTSCALLPQRGFAAAHRRYETGPRPGLRLHRVSRCSWGTTTS